MTFGDRVIEFNKHLKYTGKQLPENIRIMNPFRENAEVMPAVRAFYNKYYHDNHQRHLILGINPGRFGAGATGIPFTDPKRLVSECGIPYIGKVTHEPSSVFIYEMINAYGGPALFYKHFFINSPSPLGFVSASGDGKETNYNYYDSPTLLDAVEGFIIQNLETLCKMEIERDVCFCFGTGKNYKYLGQLNKRYHFFGKLVALEHPRFIMQYKNKQKELYIQRYLDAFRSVRAKEAR
jgi:hypothetical protein